MFEIGTSLREARLRQHLEIPEIETVTKVRGKYLRALEEEQFEVLPAETYVKGFLRAYADYLGLDGQLYVDEFNSRYVVGEDEPQTRPRRVARPRPRRHVESNVILFALVGIGILTALVIAAWKFGGAEPPPVINQGRTGAEGAAGAPRVQRHVPSVAKLLVTATRGSSWLQVHVGSPTGRLLFQGTLERKTSMPFSAKRLWINVGAPENLTVKLNGKFRRLPGGGPQVVVVTPKGIRRATPA
jgi:cytoskeleton protein RodZ